MTNTYEKIRGEVVAGGALGEEDEPVGGARAVLGIGVILGLLVVLAIASFWAFVFVFGILVSIFLHEVGHFVTARRSGMKVTQFFMGMGPKLWSFRRGEIEYGVRLLPIGAFVRIIGMNNLDETPEEDEDRTYRSKSYPRKMLTITAGSLMHMLIAIVLLMTVYSTWGRIEETGRVGIVEVTANSGAAAAGIEPDDIVVSIDGQAVDSYQDVAGAIRRNAVGDVISVVVLRDGKQLDLSARLGANPDEPELAYLGIRSGDERDFVGRSLGWSAVHSITDLGSVAWQSVGGVVKVMNPVNIYEHLVGTANDPETQPVTIYGVSRISADIGDNSGLAGVLLVLAGVNVFVGILNMVPLLPFDGGHAAVATYERIRSRKGKRYVADVGKMVPVAMAVMTFLVFIMLTGIYLDIAKPIK